MQGVLSGVSPLIGYFLGWLLGRIAYLFGYRPHWPLATMTALHGVLFALADLRVDKDEPPPTSALRTAGPGSRLDWAKLGAEGRRFLSDGPTAAQVSAVSGRPAEEPIRLYVGRESADILNTRIDLLMAEMDRTGAFARGSIVLALTTGTGWMNERNFQPAEYMLGGDAARRLIGDGSKVAFAQAARALLGTAPQIVYLQNADDPIAWWDPAMAFTSPDWISVTQDKV